jgi:dipeptide/tripeptide permease
VGKWVPEHERTTAWNALTVGEAGGTIVAMLSSPWLAAHGGWPLIFYTSGGLGVLWLILFTLLVTETPETHPWISHAERDYIVGARQRAVGRTTAPPSFCEVPWRGFVRHRPFWATVCAHACYNYMSFLALSLGPYFFKTKYNVDISSPESGLGVYACLPYVVLFVAQAVAGVVADGLRGNGRFTLTAIRKGFNTAGLLVATAGFAVLASPALQHGGTGTTGLHTALAVLTVAVGVGGIAITGHWANYRDLSSTYSPHLLAIGTSIATIPGMVTNLVSGTLLDRIDRDPASTAEAWSHVFAITAGVSLIGALVFLVFGSATQVNFDK